MTEANKWTPVQWIQPPKVDSEESPLSYGEEGCIIYADMVNSTVLWNRINESGTVLREVCWKYLHGIQNVVIRMFIESLSCNFVKGTGDGFIFHTDDVHKGFFASRDAFQEVKNYATQPAATKIISEVEPADPDLAKLLKEISFRFVVHWANEKLVHAVIHIPPATRTWNSNSGLQPVFRQPYDSSSISLLVEPSYPDLFGHNMNYAGRCIHVIADDGVYLTDNASDKLEDDKVGAKNVDWPLQISAKGLTHYLRFRKYLQPTELPNPDATISTYKTKALVIRRLGTADASTLFRSIKDFMEETPAEGCTFEKLHPHLFWACHIRLAGEFDRNGDKVESKILADDDKERLVLRLEATDQEYMEDIAINDAYGLNRFNYQALEGKSENGRDGIEDTETRFLRAANIENANDKQIWLKRNEKYYPSERKPSVWFCEIYVSKVTDIDNIARNLVTRASSIRVIELCRLWGKPAIYLIVQAVGAQDSTISAQTLAKKIGESNPSAHFKSICLWNCLKLVHATDRRET